MSKWDMPPEVHCFKQSSIPARDMESGPIVAFGDSITQSAYLKVEERWTTLLQDKLKCKVVNAGIGGTSSAFGLWRLNRDVLELKPSLVIICFLLNDGHISFWETTESYSPRISIVQSSQCMAEIIRQCKRIGAKVLLWTANPVGHNYPMANLEDCPLCAEFHQIQQDRYRFYLAELKKIALRENVPIADTYKLYLERTDYEEYLHPDHIHPNEKAQLLIADCIEKKCREV